MHFETFSCKRSSTAEAPTIVRSLSTSSTCRSSHCHSYFFLSPSASSPMSVLFPSGSGNILLSPPLIISSSSISPGLVTRLLALNASRIRCKDSSSNSLNANASVRSPLPEKSSMSCAIASIPSSWRQFLATKLSAPLTKAKIRPSSSLTTMLEHLRSEVKGKTLRTLNDFYSPSGYMIFIESLSRSWK